MQRTRTPELPAEDQEADIEMPLLFTLSDMEKEGIRVNAQALKEYGDQLYVRIQELEKEIYREAGDWTQEILRTRYSTMN